MRKINRDDVKNLVIGGCILGGGGGGSMLSGQKFGDLALDINEIILLDIEELNDDDLTVCASMVGAPSSKESYVDKEDYIFTIDKFSEYIDQDIKAIFTNENGGGSSFNGFMQAALTGIPLVDAIGNGRAHPTGIMGSLNLHKKKDYNSIQVYSGGNSIINKNLRGVVEGDIKNSAKTIRNAAVLAGGMVAVMRNQVEASYLRKNGAVNGLSHAIELGKVYNLAKEKDICPIKEVVKFLKGEIVACGEVQNYKLNMDGGFDVGKFNVNSFELTFWNEYMTLAKDEELYRFPDLIMTFDKKTKLPITSAELKEGMEIVVIATSKENLILSSTMYEKDLLEEVGEIIEKDFKK